MLKRVRFCGPRRTLFKTLLLALNRSTRLSVIKTGRVGAIGMDGRAPKIEGEESEERVFHSAKGFMLVEVSMVVVLVLFEDESERGRERCVIGARRWGILGRKTLLKYIPRRHHGGGTEREKV